MLSPCIPEGEDLDSSISCCVLNTQNTVWNIVEIQDTSMKKVKLSMKKVKWKS